MHNAFRQFLLHRTELLPLRSARLKYKARNGGHPDWVELIGADWEAWTKARAAAKGGQRILIATGVGLHFGATHLESLLGIALTLRGGEVDFLLCDGILPACLACTLDWFPDPGGLTERGPKAHLCSPCFDPAAKMINALGLTLRRYGEFLRDTDFDEARAIANATDAEAIPSFRDKLGIAVGEHSLAGALRYFARGELQSEPEGEVVLRRFFEAGLLTSAAIQRLLERERYECVVLHHGIYIPQGIVSEAARAAGMRVVTWFPAYRRNTFIFSHGKTYHHELMDEPLDAWEDIPWSEERDRIIGDYLESRASGARDWITFHNHAETEIGAIEAAVGIDFSKPTIGLLTNVVWDAQLHYPQNAFASMSEWLCKTVSWFADRPELQLLIRVHPAELTGNIKSRQKVSEELERVFGTLPKNVFLIGPESPISTYAAMTACDSVIIYGTKTGVELASIGIPVIVAGEAWIKGKGISLNADTEAEYFEILKRLPLGRRMDTEAVARARRYAYHFFFRRMVHLEHTVPQAGFPPFRVTFEDGLSALMPGASSGLDVLCLGVLNGDAFSADHPC